MTVGYSASNNPLSSFGLSANSKIIRNGCPTDITHIKQYDVLTYSKNSNTIFVTDKKAVGTLEDAYPSIKQPRTVTVNGIVYNVASTAFESFSRYSLGNIVTLILDEDNNVVSAQPPMTVSGWGILKEAKIDSAIVLLSDGTELNLKGKYSGSIILETSYGSLVEFSHSGSSAKISLMNIKDNIGATCNFDEMIIGKNKIALSAVIYETIGDTTVTKKLDIDDLNTVYTNGNVRGCHINEEGYADIVILKEASISSKTYGFITQIISEDESGNSRNYSFKYLDEKGNNKTLSFSKKLYEVGEKEGLVGVQFDILGRIRNIHTPKLLGKVTKDNFYFDESITIGSKTYEIAENCPVYNKATETLYSIDKAKTLYESFTVYIESDVNPIVVAITAE